MDTNLIITLPKKDANNPMAYLEILRQYKPPAYTTVLFAGTESQYEILQSIFGDYDDSRTNIIDFWKNTSPIYHEEPLKAMLKDVSPDRYSLAIFVER